MKGCKSGFCNDSFMRTVEFFCHGNWSQELRNSSQTNENLVRRFMSHWQVHIISIHLWETGCNNWGRGMVKYVHNNSLLQFFSNFHDNQNSTIHTKLASQELHLQVCNSDWILMKFASVVANYPIHHSFWTHSNVAWV